MNYRISVDTGGTFTDVVLEVDGRLELSKALSTRSRGSEAILHALSDIAAGVGLDVGELLARSNELRYGTTIATNAIVESKTAKTAFFTTRGFPDILLLREGGKADPFSRPPFPKPYVPRYLTYEIGGRISAEGTVLEELSDVDLTLAIESARDAGCEAVGVCLLWSIANDEHELAIERRLRELAPEMEYTLSHKINPIIREYRRASATVIDASLKPLVRRFFSNLESDLREAGFAGDFLISTSFGGAARTEDVMAAPIQIVSSGPSMAPVAARVYTRADLEGVAPTEDLLVCDTGGTTFDVSIVENGELQYTTETWIGEKWMGHLTGARAVDVKSVGAGGGSIAWVDDGGLIHVGPQSAGAEPGPACYGRGGDQPTVTDAALVLGYLDENNFLGGKMSLDHEAAMRVFERFGAQTGMSPEAAADATLMLSSENIVTAIRQITIDRGIDPRSLSVVAGGGASGLNIAEIARELQCKNILVPPTAAALSACGALFSELVSEFTTSHFAETRKADFDQIASVLSDLDRRARDFLDSVADLRPVSSRLEFSVSARYPRQVWELDVPLEAGKHFGPADVADLEERFHEAHDRAFAVMQPGEPLECLAWAVRAYAVLEKPQLIPDGRADGARLEDAAAVRPAYFRSLGRVDTPRYDGTLLGPGTTLSGPALIHEPTTTIVIPPDFNVNVTMTGGYHLTPKDIDESEEDQR